MAQIKKITIGEDYIDFEEFKKEIYTEVDKKDVTTRNLTEHYNPRDIMTVLGETDVRRAFQLLSQKSTNNGDFSDLRVGDYIDIPNLHTYTGNTRFEIAAFDHYLNRGTSGNIITQHHITMISYDLVEKRQMHSSKENKYYYNRALAIHLNTTINNAIIKATGVTPLPITLQWDYHNTITAPLSVYVPQIEEVMSPGSGWGTLNYRGRQWWNDQTMWGQYGSPTLSSQFPLFAKYPHRMRKKFNGTYIPWWTSTPDRDHTLGFSVVPVDGVDANGNGTAFVAYASLSHGVALTFNL